MKKEMVRVIVQGATCTGKSTVAFVIFQALKKAGFVPAIYDTEMLIPETCENKLKGLQGTAVDIETKQCRTYTGK